MERVYRSGSQSRQYGPVTTDCDHQQMDSTDTLRGGTRHELTVEPGASPGRDGEGDRARQRVGDEDETGSLFGPPSVDPQPAHRTGVTRRFAGIWGCTHVAPVAGGAETAQPDIGPLPCRESNNEGDLTITDSESEPLDQLQATAHSAFPGVTGDV